MCFEQAEPFREPGTVGASPALFGPLDSFSILSVTVYAGSKSGEKFFFCFFVFCKSTAVAIRQSDSLYTSSLTKKDEEIQLKRLKRRWTLWGHPPVQRALPSLGDQFALHFWRLPCCNRLLCSTAGYQQDLLNGANRPSVSKSEAQIQNATKLQSWMSL